jgi:predicted RNA-binding Zn-ribbon protein involved in translation (DUF1610 family)
VLSLDRSYIQAMPMANATPFACPTCGADYEVVRVAAPAAMPEGRLTCVKCGGPLHAREGRYILKYFLVGVAIRKPLRARTKS